MPILGTTANNSADDKDLSQTNIRDCGRGTAAYLFTKMRIMLGRSLTHPEKTVTPPDKPDQPLQPEVEESDQARKEHLDEALDEALEESFPASDPPAVH